MGRRTTTVGNKRKCHRCKQMVLLEDFAKFKTQWAPEGFYYRSDCKACYREFMKEQYRKKAHIRLSEWQAKDMRAILIQLEGTAKDLMEPVIKQLNRQIEKLEKWNSSKH